MIQQPRKTRAVRCRHVPRSMPRRVAGWGLIVLALLGMALPILPGLIFLAFAIVLLGPHDPVLRRAGFTIRMLLRHFSRLRHPWLRALGRAVRWRYAATRKQVREVLHQHERGENTWRTHLPMLAMLLLGLTASAAIGTLVARTIP